jgi:hypothetical protein
MEQLSCAQIVLAMTTMMTTLIAKASLVKILATAASPLPITMVTVSELATPSSLRL